MKCIFLEYATFVKGYQLWCTQEGRTLKFIMSRDVKFDESSFGNQGGGDTSQERNKYQGASQKEEFPTQTPARVVISDKEQGRNEKIGQDETQEQPM